MIPECASLLPGYGLEYASLRPGCDLSIHSGSTQATPAASGIRWPRFVVYPEYRKIEARKGPHATRRLGGRYEAYMGAEISFAELDAGGLGSAKPDRVVGNGLGFLCQKW